MDILRNAILALLPAATGCRLLMYIIQLSHDPDAKPQIIKRIKYLLMFFLFAEGIFGLISAIWINFPMLIP